MLFMNAGKFLMAGLLASFVFLASCGDNGEKKSGEGTEASATPSTNEGTDPKGIGKFTNVELTHPLDETMVTAGKSVYELKCASCHKLTEEKLVGPGFSKVTDRRTPEWIMNFVTNTDVMIEKDTAAQRLLEQCLVRMPNQNLSDEDARNVLEFLRKNDGKN
jgi:hypothetical protein